MAISEIEKKLFERFPEFKESNEKANYYESCRENNTLTNPEKLNNSLQAMSDSIFYDSKIQENLTEEVKQNYIEMHNDKKYIDKPLTPSVSNIVDINRVREEKSRKLV